MRLLPSAIFVCVATVASAQTLPDVAPVDQLPNVPVEQPKPLIGEVAPPSPTPSAEHEWLRQLAGTWAFCGKFGENPENAPTVCNGKYEIRAMGDYWVVADVQSAYPGGKMTAVLQLGYDPDAGRFVGTWADTTHHHLWRYSGSLSEDGKTLTLETSGPNVMTGTGTASYRDNFTVVSEDRIEQKTEIKSGGGFRTMATGELTRSE